MQKILAVQDKKVHDMTTFFQLVDEKYDGRFSNLVNDLEELNLQTYKATKGTSKKARKKRYDELQEIIDALKKVRTSPNLFIKW